MLARFVSTGPDLGFVWVHATPWLLLLLFRKLACLCLVRQIGCEMLSRGLKEIFGPSNSNGMVNVIVVNNKLQLELVDLIWSCLRLPSQRQMYVACVLHCM